MTRAFAYANGVWEQTTGYDLSLGPGKEMAAPGDHKRPLQDNYVSHVHDEIIGGGEIRWGIQSNLFWSERFLAISSGAGGLYSANGHFSIDCLTSTAGAIPVIAGAPARNWQDYGIVLNNGETLWYILPLGTTDANPQLTRPANFRLAGVASDFQPGNDWVLVASVNDEDVRICNGMRLSRFGNSTISPDTGWRGVVFENGWRDYGAPWESTAYRRMNGMVYLRGLTIVGTAGWNIPAFTLPYGFRPLGDMHLPGAQHGQSSPINISANGVVGLNTLRVAGGWCSFDVPAFPAAV